MFNKRGFNPYWHLHERILQTEDPTFMWDYKISVPVNKHYPLSKFYINHNNAKPTKGSTLYLEDISSENSSSGESVATYVIRSVTNCEPVLSLDNESITSNATYAMEKKESENKPYKGHSVNSWRIVPMTILRGRCCSGL